MTKQSDKALWESIHKLIESVSEVAGSLKSHVRSCEQSHKNVEAKLDQLLDKVAENSKRTTRLEERNKHVDNGKDKPTNIANIPLPKEPKTTIAYFAGIAIVIIAITQRDHPAIIALIEAML